ncbi:hypothetical protein [Cupriavidus sp. UME77]|uniref:hypothetical protein n=1 Tax=Cupriavidus sp. UME77 TaxID=1862321 RepID=UPI001602CE86|nr:hypothetical protein [Cupriavidus sp. UME77]
MNAQSGQARQISAVAIATVVAVASVALIVGGYWMARIAAQPDSGAAQARQGSVS